jgi:hypothetical protein
MLRHTTPNSGDCSPSLRDPNKPTRSYHEPEIKGHRYGEVDPMINNLYGYEGSSPEKIQAIQDLTQYIYQADRHQVSALVRRMAMLLPTAETEEERTIDHLIQYLADSAEINDHEIIRTPSLIEPPIQLLFALAIAGKSQKEFEKFFEKSKKLERLRNAAFFMDMTATHMAVSYHMLQAQLARPKPDTMQIAKVLNAITAIHAGPHINRLIRAFAETEYFPGGINIVTQQLLLKLGIEQKIQSDNHAQAYLPTNRMIHGAVFLRYMGMSNHVDPARRYRPTGKDFTNMNILISLSRFSNINLQEVIQQ